MCQTSSTKLHYLISSKQQGGLQVATAAVWRHLRCCIIWAATASLQEVPIPHDIAQPKVSYFHIHLAVQEQVLRFQIPVHHHVAVAIFHTRNDLLEKASCLFLEEPAFLNNVIKQLSSLRNATRKCATICMRAVHFCLSFSVQQSAACCSCKFTFFVAESISCRIGKYIKGKKQNNKPHPKGQKLEHVWAGIAAGWIHQSCTSLDMQHSAYSHQQAFQLTMCSSK